MNIFLSFSIFLQASIACYPPWSHFSENNGSRPSDPVQPVLDVLPLQCLAPSGPPPNMNATSTTKSDDSSSSVEINPGPSFGELPAMVFLSSLPTNEEWNNIITATKSGVALTGSAAMGKVGPAIGSVDIGESEDEYLFRVSLPGAVRDEKNFTCDVQHDGEITITGLTSTGEKMVRRDSMVFEMQTQNLCPPGEFSISFQLPGPIDYEKPIKGVFGSDGIFEATVKKRPSKGRRVI
ncbi:alpha-crystallin domain-containing protein 22.3-like isoform X3 [Coffea arabica]|uniref:Alpha-crystallin domain-containing protein 22.3-like isoform X3 n=1 Tax=Coffea arabica TaxID=13443 RepID=A0ABM4WYU6_COFAR